MLVWRGSLPDALAQRRVHAAEHGLQCSAVQCCSVECSAAECSAMQCLLEPQCLALFWGSRSWPYSGAADGHTSCPRSKKRRWASILLAMASRNSKRLRLSSSVSFLAHSKRASSAHDCRAHTHAHHKSNFGVHPGQTNSRLLLSTGGDLNSVTYDHMWSALPICR